MSLNTVKLTKYSRLQNLKLIEDPKSNYSSWSSTSNGKGEYNNSSDALLCYNHFSSFSTKNLKMSQTWKDFNHCLPGNSHLHGPSIVDVYLSLHKGERSLITRSTNTYELNTPN